MVGEFQGFNEAVIAQAQLQSQESEIQNIISTQKQQNLQDRKTIAKQARAELLARGTVDPFQLKAARLAITERESTISDTQQQLEAQKQIISTQKSQIKTKEELEKQGFEKKISGDKTIYFKEDTYKKTKDSNKRTFIKEEYTFINGEISKVVTRDDFSVGDSRKVKEEEIIRFQNGKVLEFDEFNKGERIKSENYDIQGRIINLVEYDSKGNKEQTQNFNYNDQAGTVQIKTKDFDKKTSKTQDVNISAELFGVGTSKETEVIKTTKGGVTTIQTTTRDLGKVKPKTKTETKTIKTLDTQQPNILTNLDFSQPVSTIPKVKEFQTRIKTKTTPDIEKKGIFQTAGTVFQQTGQKLGQFEVDDKQNVFGLPKTVEKTVRVIGAGVQTFGEFVSLGSAPSTFIEGSVQSAEKRSKIKTLKGQEFGFTDAILSIGSGIGATATEIQTGSPTISKVVTQDLQFTGQKLRSAGQKIEQADIVPEPIETKFTEFKEVSRQKFETLSQEGVKLSIEGFQQTQPRKIQTTIPKVQEFQNIIGINQKVKPTISQRVIGTVKQDIGIAFVLAGETGKGIVQPIKTARKTEEILAGVETNIPQLKFFADVSEVAVGGVIGTASILQDPKLYISQEFEEAALLAISPRSRGKEIVETVAFQPKEFLKASIGESIFQTGAFTLGKIAATDVEIGTRIAASEITDLAIDLTVKKPDIDTTDSFSRTSPFDPPEFVSLKSDDIKPIKQKPIPAGIETNGEFAVQTDIVSFEFPNILDFQRPSVTIKGQTKIQPIESFTTIGTTFNNIAEIQIEQENKSELSFDFRDRQEIKFDERFREETKSEIKFDSKFDTRFDPEIKFDSRLDTKFEEKTKQDIKFDTRFDTKFDERFDTRTDTRFDTRFDMIPTESRKKKKKKGGDFSIGEGIFISSLGGLLTGKTTKEPTKALTGLELRGILIKK